MTTEFGPLSREQSRRVDQIAIDDFGMDGLVLMENAARGCAEIAASMIPDGPPGVIAILCGKGNNGGDGFAMARHLDNAGFKVRVFAVTGEDGLASDAAANFRLLQWVAAEVVVGESPPEGLQNADLVVDAMLGTGVTGPPRPPLDRWIDTANGCGTPLLAVDVPSGLDCDAGTAEGACVRANVTATFVAKKIGFGATGAASFLGDLKVVDIGVPLRAVARQLRAEQTSEDRD